MELAIVMLNCFDVGSRLMCSEMDWSVRPELPIRI